MADSAPFDLFLAHVCRRNQDHSSSAIAADVDVKADDHLEQCSGQRLLGGISPKSTVKRVNPPLAVLSPW
jgi:hypothetical protein